MKKCPECGREFEPAPRHPHQIYCSEKCGGRASSRRQCERLRAARRPPEPRRCALCGAVFTPSRKGNVYCSRKCGKRADNLKHHTKAEPRKCAMCGAVFTPRRHGQRFCSHACYYRAWMEANHRAPAAEPRKCEHCGTSFTPRRRDQRFCSVRCRWAHKSRARRPVSARSPGAGVDRERVIAYLRLPDDERYARRKELNQAERLLAMRIWNEWHAREEW